MTVYAVNLTDNDTSPALQYGSLYHINTRYVYGDEIEQERLPAPVTDALDRAADDFQPKDDYLLLTGDYIQLVDFAARLGARYGAFRVLRWDKKAAGYIPAIIQVSRQQFDRPLY